MMLMRPGGPESRDGTGRRLCVTMDLNMFLYTELKSLVV